LKLKYNKNSEYFGKYYIEFNYDIYEKNKPEYEYNEIPEYNYYFILFNKKNIEKIKNEFIKKKYDLIEFKIKYIYDKNKKIKYINKIYFNKLNDKKDKIYEDLYHIFNLKIGLVLKNKIDNLIELEILGSDSVSEEILNEYYKNIDIYNRKEKRDKEIIFNLKNKKNLKLLVENILNKKIIIKEYILRRSQFLNTYKIDGLKFELIK
jgi:hypothetical protein